MISKQLIEDGCLAIEELSLQLKRHRLYLEEHCTLCGSYLPTSTDRQLHLGSSACYYNKQKSSPEPEPDPDPDQEPDGKYQCGSCEQFFDKPVLLSPPNCPTGEGSLYRKGKAMYSDCPHCGSGNWVRGCIDEDELETCSFQTLLLATITSLLRKEPKI